MYLYRKLHDMIFDVKINNLSLLVSSSEPFVLGGQPGDDDRIFVNNRIERAPDYTEGEKE